MKSRSDLKMKGSGSHTRHTDGHTVVIPLPDPRLLLLVARFAILAAMLCSIPWLRRTSPRVNLVQSYHLSSDLFNLLSSQDPFCLPLPIGDLQREGIFSSDSQKVIFLGDAKSRLTFLENGIENVPLDQGSTVSDHTVDFAFASEGFDDSSFRVLDRVLKIGGIAVILLSNSDDSDPFRLPANYKLVYLRRIKCSILGLKKVAQPNSENGISEKESGTGTGNRRQLLAVPLVKKDVSHQVEEVLLELPREKGETRKIKFLPELTGDQLTQYPRRLFINAELRSIANGERWFEENYPKKGSTFEMVKLNAIGKAKTCAKAHRVSDWLLRNVKEEEFVVMKADAGIIEEMVNAKEKAIQLIDELFLECDATRAYWECLELYGKVKDEGVVIHQWWG